jgi:lysophospholipase L1-like esterase
MQQSPASIVILNYGINDSREESKEDVARFKTIEAELVRIAKQNGKQVVIATSNPVNFAPCKTLPDYAAAAAEFARSQRLPLVDQYRYLSSIDWPPLTSDGAHPSQAGYEVKARREFEVIAPMVAQLLR